MSDIVLDLPSHLCDRWMSALESVLLGRLRLSLRSARCWGIERMRKAWQRSLVQLGRLGISGPAAAAWLRTWNGLAGTRTPDLVWSGPEVAGLHARDTRRVYEGLLGSPELSICGS
jgi:hypothetical protein